MGPLTQRGTARSTRIMVASSRHTTCHEGSVIDEDRQGSSQRQGRCSRAARQDYVSGKPARSELQKRQSAKRVLMQEPKGASVRLLMNSSIMSASRALQQESQGASTAVFSRSQVSLSKTANEQQHHVSVAGATAREPRDLNTLCK